LKHVTHQWDDNHTIAAFTTHASLTHHNETHSTPRGNPSKHINNSYHSPWT
jgi:hypothetical protein